MPVTLQQIAEAAGVSRGTVDRALKNRGRVNAEVAERIRKIAKEMGYQPVLVEDCISSRNLHDKEIALLRARDEGALLTTSESILFELTVTAEHEQFKQISKLVK